MRARRKPWADKEIATNPRMISNPEEYKGRWNEYFKNDNPIHIEIGSGKGRFITETAKLNQNINYIAIEREKNVIITGMRNSKEEVCSLGFILGDVMNIETFFEANELDRIYINFCDPWQNRNKWHKRRLTYRDFLDRYERLICLNGEIHFKTDNTELFEFSLNEFSLKKWQMKNISLDLHNSKFEGNIMTEYEEKFSSQGMQIYRLEATSPKTI